MQGGVPNVFFRDGRSMRALRRIGWPGVNGTATKADNRCSIRADRQPVPNSDGAFLFWGRPFHQHLSGRQVVLNEPALAAHIGSLTPLRIDVGNAVMLDDKHDDPLSGGEYGSG